MTKISESKSPWEEEKPLEQESSQLEGPKKSLLDKLFPTSIRVGFSRHKENEPDMQKSGESEMPTISVGGLSGGNDFWSWLRWLLLAALLALIIGLIIWFFFLRDNHSLVGESAGSDPSAAVVDSWSQSPKTPSYHGIVRNDQISMLPPGVTTRKIDDTFSEVITDDPSKIDRKIVQDEQTVAVPPPPKEMESADCPASLAGWESGKLGMNMFVADYLKSKSKNLKVAVIDSGLNSWMSDIDYSRVDFTGSINVADGNSTLEDPVGHGTMVTTFVQKFYPSATILAIKANRAGEDAFSDIGVSRAIDHAIEQKADVINISLWGSGAFSNLVGPKIRKARELGIVVIAAAGNDAAPTADYYPASYSGVVSVWSYNSDNLLSVFSNKGADNLSPGECVFANGKFAHGTSFASPILAANALTLMSHKSLSGSESDILAALSGASIREKWMPLFNYPKALGIQAENAEYVGAADSLAKNYASMLASVKTFRKSLSEVKDKAAYMTAFSKFGSDFAKQKAQIEAATTKIDALYVKKSVPKGVDIRKYLDDAKGNLQDVQDFLDGKSVMLDVTNDKRLKSSLGVDTCIPEKSCSDFPNATGCETRYFLGDRYACNLMSSIIPSESSLPASGSGYYSVIDPDQTYLFFTIFQWNGESVSQNRLLWSIQISWLSSDAIKERGAIVTFSINESGLLSVTASDKANPSNSVSTKIISNIRLDSNYFDSQSVNRAEQYFIAAERKIENFISAWK